MQHFIDFPGHVFSWLLAVDGLLWFPLLWWLGGYAPGMLALAACSLRKSGKPGVWNGADWLSVIVPYPLWVLLCFLVPDSMKDGGNFWEPIWIGWLWSAGIGLRIHLANREIDAACLRKGAWLLAGVVSAGLCLIFFLTPSLPCSFYPTP